MINKAYEMREYQIKRNYRKYIYNIQKKANLNLEQ